jgi:hypothetical protein
LPSSSISFAKFLLVAACIEFHCYRRQAIRHSTRDMKIRRSREPGSWMSHEPCSQFRIICCCAFCISFKIQSSVLHHYMPVFKLRYLLQLKVHIFCMATNRRRRAPWPARKWSGCPPSFQAACRAKKRLDNLQDVESGGMSPMPTQRRGHGLPV